MSAGAPWPVLDLFAGYGGFSLAFDAVWDVADADATGRAHRTGEHRRDGAPGGPRVGRAGGRRPLFRTVGFSEIDPYVSAVLAERFPGIPNLGAVQYVTRDSVLAACGVLPVVVTGGFPCQPHSVAGNRGAGDDERDLWGECLRVLRDVRPPFAIFENVPGLFTSDATSPDGVDQSGLFFNRILSDLAEVRYAALWSVVSASDVGAPHKRDRVWILCVDELAYAARVGLGEGKRGDAVRLTGGASDRRSVADGQSRGRGECGASALARRIGHVDGGSSGLADAGRAGRSEVARRASGDESAHEGRAEELDNFAHSVGEVDSDGTGELAEVGRSTMANAQRERRCGGNDEREYAAHVVASSARTPRARDWPAAEGRWPAPPGPDQYDWEPARVVGGARGGRMVDAASGRRAARSEPGAYGFAADEGTRGAGLDERRSGEVEPVVGGGAHGSADRVDATAAEVRQAARAEVDDFTFNDAREAAGADNLNRLSDDDLEALADADEADGLSDSVNRVHRLKATGNGIVPACAYVFAAAIADVITARGLPQ